MVYRTYSRRWGVLMSVIVCNMASLMMVSSLAPVAPMATKYFNIDGDTMDLLIIFCNVLNFIGMLAAIYCVDVYGLQRSIQIGSTGIALGSIIRFLSTFPSYEASIEPRTKWWLTLSGQLVMALSHPFISSLATKVSQAWFSEKERILSTASIAMSAPLGGMIGSGVSPIIVNGNWENIPYINIYFPVVGMLGCVLSWCSVTMPIPPTPPSASAQQDIARGKARLTLKDCAVTSKNIFKNPTTVCLIVAMGGGFAVFQTLATQLAQIMCVNGYPRNAAGMVVVAMIFAGILGAVIIGSRAKRLNRLEDFAKTSFCLSAISFIFVLLALREEDVLPGLFIAMFVAGFTGLGVVPIVLEICAEEVYPVNPVFPETFIRASEAIWSLILVPLCNAMHWDPSPHQLQVQNCRSKEQELHGTGLVPWDYTPYFYFLMSISTAGVFGFLWFVNANMNRAKVDLQQQTFTEPQYVNTEPEYVNTEPECVNKEPEYVNTEPEYVNTEPEYVNKGPEYINTKPLNVNTESQYVNTEAI